MDYVDILQWRSQRDVKKHRTTGKHYNYSLKGFNEKW